MDALAPPEETSGPSRDEPEILVAFDPLAAGAQFHTFRSTGANEPSARIDLGWRKKIDREGARNAEGIEVPSEDFLCVASGPRYVVCVIVDGTSTSYHSEVAAKAVATELTYHLWDHREQWPERPEIEELLQRAQEPVQERLVRIPVPEHFGGARLRRRLRTRDEAGGQLVGVATVCDVRARRARVYQFGDTHLWVHTRDRSGGQSGSNPPCEFHKGGDRARWSSVGSADMELQVGDWADVRAVVVSSDGLPEDWALVADGATLEERFWRENTIHAGLDDLAVALIDFDGASRDAVRDWPEPVLAERSDEDDPTVESIASWRLHAELDAPAVVVDLDDEAADPPDEVAIPDVPDPAPPVHTSTPGDSEPRIPALRRASDDNEPGGGGREPTLTDGGGMAGEPPGPEPGPPPAPSRVPPPAGPARRPPTVPPAVLVLAAVVLIGVGAALLLPALRGSGRPVEPPTASAVSDPPTAAPRRLLKMAEVVTTADAVRGELERTLSKLQEASAALDGLPAPPRPPRGDKAPRRGWLQDARSLVAAHDTATAEVNRVAGSIPDTLSILTASIEAERARSADADTAAAEEAIRNLEAADAASVVALEASLGDPAAAFREGTVDYARGVCTTWRPKAAAAVEATGARVDAMRLRAAPVREAARAWPAGQREQVEQLESEVNELPRKAKKIETERDVLAMCTFTRGATLLRVVDSALNKIDAGVSVRSQLAALKLDETMRAFEGRLVPLEKMAGMDPAHSPAAGSQKHDDAVRSSFRGFCEGMRGTQADPRPMTILRYDDWSRQAAELGLVDARAERLAALDRQLDEKLEILGRLCAVEPSTTSPDELALRATQGLGPSLVIVQQLAAFPAQIELPDNQPPKYWAAQKILLNAVRNQCIHLQETIAPTVAPPRQLQACKARR